VGKWKGKSGMISASTYEKIEGIVTKCGWSVTANDQKTLTVATQGTTPITCLITPMNDDFASFSVSSQLIDHLLVSQFPSASFDSLSLDYELPQVLRTALFLALKLGNDPVQQYQVKETTMGKRTELDLYHQAKEQIGRNIHTKNLFVFWEGKCALTPVTCKPLLVGTFSKPWDDCTSTRDRMDVHNGFLLEVRYARLFEQGLITFENDGTMILSSKLSQGDITSLYIDRNLKLRKIEKPHQKYLLWHRTKVFLT